MQINTKKGFTLIELLIVIGILAILSTAVVLILNPAQMLAEARDSQRMADLGAVQTALGLFLVSATTTTLTAGPFSNVTGSEASCGFTNVSPPVENCVVRAVFTVAGAGWVAADLTQTSGGSPLATLPRDPTNSATYFYAFKADNSLKTFELNGRLESAKYRVKMGNAAGTGGTDGGNRNTCTDFTERTCFYEVGNDPGLDI